MIGLLVKFRGGIWAVQQAAAGGGSKVWRRLNRLLFDRFMWSNGSYFGTRATVLGPPTFPHGIRGIFVSNGATIGEGATIFQQVTIGSNTLADSPGQGAPTIGRNCYIGAGAKLIGGISIGDNVRIGANAVVVRDVPSNCVVVNGPVRYIQRDSVDNRFLAYQGERG